METWDSKNSCIVCLVGEGLSCDIGVLAGELREVGEDVWVVRTRTGDIAVHVDPGRRRIDANAAVQLLSFYNSCSEGFFPGVVFIHLSRSGDAFFTTDESLIFLEPSRLVSVSELAQTDFCKRKFLINRYSRKKMNRYLLRGIVVNACLPNALRNPFDPASSNRLIRRCIADKLVYLGDQEIDPDELAAEAASHVEKLHFWGGRLEQGLSWAVETFLIDTKFGLKGRIDLSLTGKSGIERIVELKSSKSWGNRVKPGHALQVAAYAMMLMQRTGRVPPRPPAVLYSGNEPVTKPKNGRLVTYLNLEKSVRVDAAMLRTVSEMRNRLLEAEITASMPFEQARPAKCRGCGDIELCYDLCAIFSDELCGSSCGRSDKDAFRNKSFPACRSKSGFDPIDIGNARRWIRALDYERIISARKSGVLMLEDTATLFSEGKALGIERHEINGSKCVLYCRNESEFREGDLVIVCTTAGPSNGAMAVAQITSVSKRKIIVSFNDRLLFKPERIYPYMSDEPFLVNYPGIVETLRRPERNLKWTLGDKPPTVSRVMNPDSRRTIEEKVLELPGLFAIQGPPGTGKTTMVCRFIEALLDRRKRLLVATMTNHAADVILRILSAKKPDYPLVRLGNYHAVDPELREYTIESILSGGSVPGRKQTVSEWREGPSVFISTSTSWLKGGLSALGPFDCTIIDEAGQLMLPSALGLACMAPSCILVGDQNQLPAVLQGSGTDEAKRTLARSLLETASRRMSAHEHSSQNVVMLEHQFRMNREICAAPSEIWYGGALEAANSEVAEARLKLDPAFNTSKYRELLDPESPSVWWSESGAGRNRSNETEVRQVLALVGELTKWGIPRPDIGVLAPFRNQVSLIRRALESAGHSAETASAMVDTVDRFQGDERNVVIISLVSPFHNRHPFDSDSRRLNVALTRAGKKRIIVGNYSALRGHGILDRLRRHRTTVFISRFAG